MSPTKLMIFCPFVNLYSSISINTNTPIQIHKRKCTNTRGANECWQGQHPSAVAASQYVQWNAVLAMCASHRPHLVGDWFKNTVFTTSIECRPISWLFKIVDVHKHCKSGVKKPFCLQPSFFSAVNKSKQTYLSPVAVSSFQHVEGDTASFFWTYKSHSKARECFYQPSNCQEKIFSLLSNLVYVLTPTDVLPPLGYLTTWHLCM